MKRLFFVLIFVFVFLTLRTQAFAQAPTPTPTPPPSEYALAYPGILPDNPLYKIKAFRDWIVSVLIADPLKKASFDVLQADKRLVATQYLLQEAPPKGPLAIETLSKGENYFFEAITQMKQAKKQGEDAYDILQKLRLSNAKHLEVVLQLEQTTAGDIHTGLQVQEKRIREFRNIVAKEGLR